MKMIAAVILAFAAVCIYSAPTEPTPSMEQPEPFVGDGCPSGSTGINTCVDRPDGDYQACETCSSFVKCVNQELIPWPCAGPIFYDSATTRCQWNSTTCSMPETTRPTTTL